MIQGCIPRNGFAAIGVQPHQIFQAIWDTIAVRIPLRVVEHWVEAVKQFPPVRHSVVVRIEGEWSPESAGVSCEGGGLGTRGAAPIIHLRVGASVVFGEVVPAIQGTAADMIKLGLISIQRTGREVLTKPMPKVAVVSNAKLSQTLLRRYFSCCEDIKSVADLFQQ